MGDSSYKGVSASQDSRFTDKQSVLLRKLTFPASFSTKVDMTRVELSVIRPWISRRITTLLGFEDDVVLEYATGMLEEERFPDPRKVQIQLMGFLEGQTAGFMEELWELLVSAQESVGGVPRRFVEEKKEELRVKREEGERVVREARERAARAAEAGGARGQEGKRRSRWDAGPTSSTSDSVAVDTRPPAYGADRRLNNGGEYRRREPPSRSEWNRRRDDDHRNGTQRSRDSGWGSRAPPPPREDTAFRDSQTRRSPSPPPRHRRRSPSPPPRQRDPPRTRSRSRSVTPDYRAEMRDRKQRDRPSKGTADSLEHDDRHSRAREDESGRRERRRDRDTQGRAVEAEGSRRKPPREDDREEEAERERDLRDKLLRAKASRSSQRSD